MTNSDFEGPPCEICGQAGQGNHFGVISCRACAAFFRRAADSKWSKMQCLSKHCDGKIYHCKPCRLKKCRLVGMDTSKFQHDRDALQIAVSRKRKLPQTVEIICGKPHFVLFCPFGPSESIKNKKENTFVDLSFLVSQAMDIMKEGAESPLIAKNGLHKLNYGYNCMKRTEEMKRITIVTRKEVTSFWEYHFLTTAKWLTYFDKFQDLDQNLKMEILFAVWHVWGRLDKLMATALYRERNKDAKWTERVIGNGMLTDTINVSTDSMWMSSYPTDQLRYFLDGIRGVDLFHLIEELQNLDLTETELTFMLAHLSFQYVSTRFGGKISEVMEGFLEELSNDLHNYYTQERMMIRYSGRLMRLLRINKEILENIRVYRGRAEVAKVFDVFNLQFSHPEMFIDTGFH
ncbi:hypothetical protein GCK72_019539 [Caenorhabditis remanei]|uniref:Uncharacterized protein n=1 Tax=Caenorhabditis remanei TaxID=31234 RepID=A0A6A5GE20_CAERE|nr:hypothetical protein GCK72_019539 [Caenorhabditis remanei]KAF1752984.1 hypothetical protein GCK72_019539 [Caenorhabditis remanei]